MCSARKIFWNDWLVSEKAASFRVPQLRTHTWSTRQIYPLYLVILFDWTIFTSTFVSDFRYLTTFVPKQWTELPMIMPEAWRLRLCSHTALHGSSVDIMHKREEPRGLSNSHLDSLRLKDKSGLYESNEGILTLQTDHVWDARLSDKLVFTQVNHVRSWRPADQEKGWWTNHSF